MTEYDCLRLVMTDDRHVVHRLFISPDEAVKCLTASPDVERRGAYWGFRVRVTERMMRMEKNHFNGSDVSWYEKCPVQLQELRCRLFAKLSNGELWGVRQFESANGKLTGRILSCRSKGIDAGRPVCQIALWQRQLSHGWITSLSHS